MEKGKILTATMLALFLMLSMASVFYPAKATHDPRIKIIPEYTKGVWPNWVNFSIYNAEGDPIVEVKITHPKEYKPIEFTMPNGFIANYMPEQRLVEFLSTDYDRYNIPAGTTGLFGIKAEEGPTVECEYEFIIGTTDKAGQAYVFYMTQKVDKTSPHVEIVQPIHHATVEARFDPIEELFYIDVYVEAYDVGVHPSGMWKVELYLDDSLYTENMSFINAVAHLWHEKVYVGKSKDEVQGTYEIKAIGYDRSYEGGNSAVDEIKITVTIKPAITIDPKEGQVGTTVTVAGHGFSENEKVWIVYRDVYKGVVYPSPAHEFNGTHLISWEPHLDSEIVAELRSDDKGQFIIEFNIPESYGYYHAIYAGEQEILYYRNGRYYFKQETYCELFEVKSKIWTDQREGIKGEYITIYGSGLPLPRFRWSAVDTTYYYTWWDLYLAIDFGPEKYWIKEDTRQLNGFTDDTMSWYMGDTYPFSFHDPLTVDSPVWAGKLCWRHDIVYKEGSPWLKVPVLTPGEYTIKLYQYGNTYQEWDGTVKQWHGDNTYFMAETSLRVIANPLTGEAILEGIKEDIAKISDQTKTILIDLDELGVIALEIKENAIIINSKLGNISTNLDALDAEILEIHSSIATIATEIGEIRVDLESINAEIIEIKDGIATIKTELGTIKSDLESINAEIIEIKDGIATISTNVGKIETSLESINAKVIDIKDGIATIKTDVGEIITDLETINPEIIEIKEGIATVSTDVGKINTKVENLKGTSLETKDKTYELNGEIAYTLIIGGIGAIAAIIAAIFAVAVWKRK